MQILSQAERQARKERFYSYCPGDSESEQSEPPSTQVKPPAKEVGEESPGEESPEMDFF